MNIYTKTGDDGTTSLIGGTRVSKNDLRVEAYGTIDELISYTGLIRDQIEETNMREVLLQIQDRLMTTASMIAADNDKAHEVSIPKIHEEDIHYLEEKINTWQEGLTPLNSFILPGGHPAVSITHVTRNVCRRAERNVLKAKEKHSVQEIIPRYLNRLSDCFFVMARKIGSDKKAKEIPWIPMVS